MSAMILDTHAAVWLVRGDLASAASQALDKAAKSGAPTYVSAITAWEVGLLVSRGRLNLGTSPERWFERLMGLPGMLLANLSPPILIASSFLPGTPPRDPADRIIIATARDLDATLVTRDRLLIDYGNDGFVSIVEC